MATLSDLGLSESRVGRDAVAILVGPNGSGKSSFLRELAETYRQQNILVVSNTPHDRFARMRGIRRISAGRSDHTPANIVKRAIERSLDERSSSFHQVSAIMYYCGYEPRFAFRIEAGRRYGKSYDELRMVTDHPNIVTGENAKDDLFPPTFDYNQELHRALAFLQRHEPGEPIWIEASASALEFSLIKEFVSVLRCEAILRRYKVIGAVNVFLQRDDKRGEIIDMHHASSGQLALISSLLFLITQGGDYPLILVDEPENSLHPGWQREYVDRLLAAMAYRGAIIVIATHAPLVVTGALSDNPGIVSVHRVRRGVPERLKIDASASPSSIEEILWEAFGVVTPANHFVSEEVVRAISRFETDEIEKDEVLKLVGDMEARSFDERQKTFFAAVRELLDKVEQAKAGFEAGDDGFA